jgi:hypothetical protein
MLEHDQRKGDRLSCREIIANPSCGIHLQRPSEKPKEVAARFNSLVAWQG